MAEQAKWYVVHTYSGYENKVAATIEKTIENRKLQDLIHEVAIPTEKVVEVHENSQKEVERKIFPGYVLVKMIMTDDSWHVVRNTRGVTGFVGPGSKPIALLRSMGRRAAVLLRELSEPFRFRSACGVEWRLRLVGSRRQVCLRQTSDR